MSIYEERPEVPIEQQEQQVQSKKSIGDYESLHNQIGTQLDYEDSVIFLTDEIESHTLTDFIIRMRSLLQHRKDKTSPINLMINSPGGDIYEMFGIIDYIESLDVKVNTICRGRAFSAAAIILVCGTGNRMMSKRSTVMFHQSSSFLGGKMSDITAYLDNVKSLETIIYGMLAEKTKKNAEWWKNKMRNDLFMTSDELMEIGVIDRII